MEYSNYTTDGRCQKFTAEHLDRYKIVVTTLGLIGRYQDRYKPDVVFIDEAAQACEPEVDCAIGVLKGSQIVLAGDPKQLGPFSSSKVAADYGFGNWSSFYLLCYILVFICRKIFAGKTYGFKCLSK